MILALNLSLLSLAPEVKDTQDIGARASRVLPLSASALNALAILDKVTLKDSMTNSEVKESLSRIDLAYKAYPMAFTMWRDWQIVLGLKLSEEEGLRAARARLEQGAIDLSWLFSDEKLKPKLVSSEWEKLKKISEAKVQREFERVSPLATGYNPNWVRSKILAIRPWDGDLQDIYSKWNVYPKVKKGAWTLTSYKDQNGAAPYWVYVPKSYREDRSNSVMMYFYGGWIGSPFSRSWASQENTIDNPTFAPVNFLEKEGMIGVMPMLNKGFAPDKSAGIEAIRGILAEVKFALNVDDDRVFGSGFSDGGTACYELCRSNPTEFAGLFAMNGWPGFKLSMRNFRNRPIVGYFCENDDLYPAKSFVKYWELYKTLAPSWQAVYVPVNGHLGVLYSDSVIPDIFGQLKNLKRDTFRDDIQIEGSKGDVLRCDWLEITDIDTSMPAQPWQEEISFLGKPSKDGTPKKYICNEFNGMVKGHWAGNELIIEASRVKGIRLYLHPKRLDFSKPLRVVINGEEKYNQVVKQEGAQVLREFMLSMDRKNLPKAILDLKL